MLNTGLCSIEESVFQHREALRSLTDLNQDPSRVLSAKNGSSSDGIAHTEGILNRNHRDASSLTNLKRANADVEIITPRSPMGKENMVTFSNTLPRANTPSVEDPVRRNATIHASMDSARSKQLLTQWKNKNESRKLSLQVMETEPGQSPPRSIEMRSSSEPSRVGVNGDHHGPGNQYLKIQPGTVPGCNNSMPGGPRVSIQSRPGSSQLVHIPEETQENISTSPKSSSARAKWLKAAEKTVACNRSNSQPRIMQVIAMSKQQGVLQSSPKNTEGSTVSCTGSIRYKTLTDHEPSGIVRVEAHPENNRPVIQIPSTEGEGSGSWKWKAPEKGSLRQTYELNDLNRDSESCESLKDSFGSGDRKRSNIDNHEHHHHGITTIRVTPVEGSEIGSETLSISSSRDSTLRRKGNIILIPERSNSPENTRNIFYKGTSPTRAYKD
ncbi:Phospholipid phosphatase-related protein type 4, partial [Eschrichtius robustus]|nr:Phospholipid phosphatase-related protein type 4 [Eschrichtius robustus]